MTQSKKEYLWMKFFSCSRYSRGFGREKSLGFFSLSPHRIDKKRKIAEKFFFRFFFWVQKREKSLFKVKMWGKKKKKIKLTKNLYQSNNKIMSLIMN